MASLLTNDRYSLYYQRISLIYQRPEVKASLELILSVFTVAVLIFAAIRPTLTNVATLQRKLDDLSSVNIRADNKITQVFNAQTQLNTFSDRLPLYDEAIPNKFSYHDIVARVELLARRRNLTVNSLSIPGTRLFGTNPGSGEWVTKLVTPNENNILQTEVVFSVSGDPSNVRLFLEEIENLDRLTFINNLTLTTETGTARGLMSLRANANMYFYFYNQQ